jgi:signal transduction histidine kinase
LKPSKAPFLVCLALTVIFIALTDPTYLSLRIIISSIGLIVLHIFPIYVLLICSTKNAAHKLLLLTLFVGGASHIYRLVVYVSQDIIEQNFVQTVQLSNYVVFITGTFITIMLTTGCTLLISLSLQKRLKDNLESLRKESEEKSKFLAMLSHEIKTPLSVLKSVISSKKITPKLVEIANQSVFEIDAIITSSQLADEIESNSIKAKFYTVNLKEAAVETAEKLNVTGSIKIDLQHSDLAETDPFLLKVILKNLVDNANKYRKPGSQIILNIYNDLELGHWSITISNEIVVGQKISKKNIVRKYYREPHSKNQSGSGLGLYLVKGFMPMLNGTMNVEIDDKNFVVKLNFFRISKN